MGDVQKNRVVYETFWARSQEIAQLAMLIADERIAVCNLFPDQAYLAGMFHDCGVLLLMQRFPTYCAEMKLGIAGQWINLLEEDRKFNADHCVVGYLVARHWHLPAYICDSHSLSPRHWRTRRPRCAQHGRHIAACDRNLLSSASVCRIRNGIRSRMMFWPNLGFHEDGLPEFVDIILERFHDDTPVAKPCAAAGFATVLLARLFLS
jgi:hypothetical protein